MWLVRYSAASVFLALIGGAAPARDVTAPAASRVDAEWRASPAWHRQGNEIRLVAPRKGAPGWLLRKDPVQDVAVSFDMQCGSPCGVGVLLTSTAIGTQRAGIYVALTDGLMGVYRLHMDGAGQEISRQPLQTQVVASRSGAEAGIFPHPASFADMPYGAAQVLPRVWNHVEVSISGDVVLAAVNSRWISGDIIGTYIVAQEGVRYGAAGVRIASGTATIRNLSVVDLNALPARPPEVTSPDFRLQRLNDFYYTETITSADINRDGLTDVIAGPYYFLAPRYDTAREIYIAKASSPALYASGLNSYAADFTGDGWPDVLEIGYPGTPAMLYVNPQGESRRWPGHPILSSVDNEASALVDMTGDGKRELVMATDGAVGFATPSADGITPWRFQAISERGGWGRIFAHGLGAGDITGDGRVDVLCAAGWWEHPEHEQSAPWRFHSFEFARSPPPGQFAAGGAQMFVYDVDGDGLNDVITSNAAHGWGLSWFRQRRSDRGEVTFDRLEIMSSEADASAAVSFSEIHAVTLADINGDGLLDIVAGKRAWAHLDTQLDPDPNGPPVLYWFELSRQANGVRFIPHSVHNMSGVGTQIEAVDLDRDGRTDILTANRRGAFVFFNSTRGRPN